MTDETTNETMSEHETAESGTAIERKTEDARSGLTHEHRKHLYLVTDHPDEETIGRVEFAPKQHLNVEKNEEGTIHIRNVETDESYEYQCVGMGFHDFESEEQADDPDAALEVIQEKMDDLDEEWLEKAGVEDV